MGESSDATAPMGVPVQQFAVFLQNRAGSLEALIQLLKQARVELLGFSVQDSRDATVARIVTSDPDTSQQPNGSYNYHVASCGYLRQCKPSTATCNVVIV